MTHLLSFNLLKRKQCNVVIQILILFVCVVGKINYETPYYNVFRCLDAAGGKKAVPI